jgi:Cys-tRNA(Pro)/Cys-tRNA(Cys) deacylase
MTPAVEAAQAAGVAFELLSYEHDPRASAYGVEAAEVLGLDAASVFKTLIAKVDGRLVVAVVPAASHLDLKALAQAVAGRKAEMAPPADAERATGYVVGGISPLGMKRRLPTVVDETALLLDVVYVSGGRRGLEIALAPADLVRLAGASVAPIARD